MSGLPQIGIQCCLNRLVPPALLLLVAFVTSASAAAPRPFKIPDAALEVVTWSDIEGWAQDDHAEAFAAFVASCQAVVRRNAADDDERPMSDALAPACRRGIAAIPLARDEARAFFEANFRPIRITPLGETAGFLTGYYEPIVEGSRTKSETYNVPLHRTPPGVGRRVVKGKAAKGKRKSRKSTSYYDRAAIEDGALDGRDLEIAWLKDPIDAFFAQIQGSVRVRFEDGVVLRLNYSGQNGHAYTPVGRILIERKIVPREEMSMDRIRQWMEANPEEGKQLRRQNKSYVFFRETRLPEEEEPAGAQGVPLTVLRSIAVDRKLHVYGTAFFIEGELPIASEQPNTKFRRLMLAQDTGGAIIGPARADLYFGAGDDAGRIAGRIRHAGRFTMLVPLEIDPVAAGARMPLPQPKPSPEEIAKAVGGAKAERTEDAEAEEPAIAAKRKRPLRRGARR
jgi:membrane-bound lytic murein transglycosylase A